ncbi:hypothetical protein [Nocardia sp. NPDC051750]|uniref:hypothetical protein n=1 Tax=Nocardia sp. NPDC051750 TaxID=3364325 RepID=UPI00378DBE38
MTWHTLRTPSEWQHGLHLTADGSVLAGTHTGLFTLAADGTTTRIDTSDDDFMELTRPDCPDKRPPDRGASSRAPLPLFSGSRPDYRGHRQCTRRVAPSRARHRP